MAGYDADHELGFVRTRQDLRFPSPKADEGAGFEEVAGDVTLLTVHVLAILGIRGIGSGVARRVVPLDSRTFLIVASQPFRALVAATPRRDYGDTARQGRRRSYLMCLFSV